MAKLEIGDEVSDAGCPVKRTALMTAAELDQLAVHRDACLARGLATGPVDRPAAEAAVRAVYRTAGLEQPRLLIWMDSPLGGVLAAGALDQPRDQLRVQLRDQLGGQLWGQLRDQLRDQLGDQLRVQLRDQLGDQLWGQFRGQLGDQLGDQFRDQLWDQLRDQLGGAIWGGQELPWLAFYAHARTLGAVYSPTLDARLDAMLATADLGWWWPYRGAVVLTDRPTVLHRDPQGRLHHESGPALAYADGWGIWAWHGVRVPETLIAGRWSTQDILRESNAEVRRCGIEKMGWDRFVVDAGLAQVGDAMPDPGNPGHYLTLYDVPERIFDEPVRVLLVTNGTPERDGTRRRFGLSVPATINSPLAAQAWLHTDDDHPVTVTTEQYAQLARRC